VRGAVVVGVPDPLPGERVAAWVAPLDGCAVGESELERFVGERIAAYKVPDWIGIDGALPTTSIGKLDRVTLETRAAERVAERPARVPDA
jgi:acyl-CoA synthetase (AMP-forming)/AMP-acid ligase II